MKHCFVLMILFSSVGVCFGQDKYFEVHRLLELLKSDSYKNDQSLLYDEDFKVTDYKMFENENYQVTFDYVNKDFVSKIVITYNTNKIPKNGQIAKDILLIITTSSDHKLRYEKDIISNDFEYTKSMFNKPLSKIFDIYTSNIDGYQTVQFSSTYLKSADYLTVYNTNIIYMQNY